MIKYVEENITLSEWEAILSKTQYSTFFHTPEWYKIFQLTYPYMKVYTLKIVLTGNKHVIFPFVKIKYLKPTMFSNSSKVFLYVSSVLKS